ncbi:MAG: TOBE domain-containing protein, partial [Acidimicrobiales bacterium]
RQKLAELKAERERLLHLASPKSVERQHSRGKMTARERIEKFYDPGTFLELGLFAKPRITGFDMLGDRVRVRLAGDVSLVAEVTPAAVAAMGLVEGESVWATVKATEIAAYAD